MNKLLYRIYNNSKILKPECSYLVMCIMAIVFLSLILLGCTTTGPSIPAQQVPDSMSGNVVISNLHPGNFQIEVYDSEEIVFLDIFRTDDTMELNLRAGTYQVCFQATEGLGLFINFLHYRECVERTVEVGNEHQWKILKYPARCCPFKSGATVIR